MAQTYRAEDQTLLSLVPSAAPVDISSNYSINGKLDRRANRKCFL